MTDQHAFEALRKLLEQAGSRGSIRTPDGHDVEVEGQPEPGILARLNAGGTDYVMFEPADAPHARYPKDLPFVPDAAVGVQELSEGRRTAHWWQPGEHVLDSLIEASNAQGWTVVESKDVAAPAAETGDATPAASSREVVIEKDGRRRTIMGSAMVVILIDES